MTIIIVTTVLALALALADVMVTRTNIKNGLAESHPLPKLLYRLSTKWAPLGHAGAYAVFIALPWIFPSGGHILGNLLLCIALSVALKRNLGLRNDQRTLSG